MTADPKSPASGLRTVWAEGLSEAIEPGDYFRSADGELVRVVSATQYMDLALIKCRPLTRWERVRRWFGG